MAWNVVILGGGFGGLYAARKLERALPPQAAKLTVVNDVNFMLYTPLLPGAAAGTLEPRHVVVPLREHLSRTDLLFERDTSVLGQLGHPPALEMPPTRAEAGGTGPPGQQTVTR
jgi:NADH dehydrogenase FAD-containing subunit